MSFPLAELGGCTIRSSPFTLFVRAPPKLTISNSLFPFLNSGVITYLLGMYFFASTYSTFDVPFILPPPASRACTSPPSCITPVKTMVTIKTNITTRRNIPCAPFSIPFFSLYSNTLPFHFIMCQKYLVYFYSYLILFYFHLESVSVVHPLLHSKKDRLLY